MADSCTAWALQRYGRLLAPGKREAKWKVFEADGHKPAIALTIVECGHMLVTQGHELLDSIPLIGAKEFLKVQRVNDILLLRFVLKGESRLMRMQFQGSSKAEALEKCSSAVFKLSEYLPVTTQGEDTESPSSCVPVTRNQPPAAASSTKQHFVGERALSLPLAYHHSPLPPGNLEAFLRTCLLDSSFPAFVEEVEGEMRRLLQED